MSSSLSYLYFISESLRGQGRGGELIQVYVFCIIFIAAVIFIVCCPPAVNKHTENTITKSLWFVPLFYTSPTPPLSPQSPTTTPGPYNKLCYHYTNFKGPVSRRRTYIISVLRGSSRKMVNNNNPPSPRPPPDVCNIL